MGVIHRYTDSSVSVITLSRSDNGNLLNGESLYELHQAVDASVKDETARVILLRSNGPTFCRGMDLVSLQNREDMGSVREALDNYVKACTSIFESGKPTVALVQGEVKAGGVGLACCCDAVLATENSSFELGEVLFGLLPANVLPFILGYRISVQKARYMVLTSKKIGADEALRIGLIDELYPAEKLERGAKNLIKRFLRSSPRALAEGKQFSLDIAHKIPEEVRDAAKEQLLSLIESEEAHQAITAFNAGDLPEWFSSFKPEHPLVYPMEEDVNG